jgi:hypothetical protein
LSKVTLVNIDPILRDTQWLRDYAKRLLRKPNICQPFPYEEFDWEELLHGELRLKYTFGDLDKYSRNIEAYKHQLPANQCGGYITAVITEMNIASLYVLFVAPVGAGTGFDALLGIEGICSCVEVGEFSTPPSAVVDGFLT